MATLWPVRALNSIRNPGYYPQETKPSRQGSDLIQQARNLRFGIQNISSVFDPWEAGRIWVESNIFPAQQHAPFYTTQPPAPMYPAYLQYQQNLQPYGGFPPQNAYNETPRTFVAPQAQPDSAHNGYIEARRTMPAPQSQPSPPLREVLLKRLAKTSHPISSPQLLSSAIDRTLSAHADPATVNPSVLLSQANDYLQRMLSAQIKLRRTTSTRIAAANLAQLQNATSILKAETTALLEFDWLRPVDAEDVFVSFIDALMVQLEGAEGGFSGQEDVRGLLEILERAMPGAGRRETVVVVEEEDRSEHGDVERKGSIAQTPVRFYGNADRAWP